MLGWEACVKRGGNRAREVFISLIGHGTVLVIVSITGARFTSSLTHLHGSSWTSSYYVIYAVAGLLGVALIAYDFLQLRRQDVMPEGGDGAGRGSAEKVRRSTAVLAIGLAVTAAFVICHIAGLLEPLYNAIRPYLPRQVYVYESSTPDARARYQEYLDEIGLMVGLALFAVSFLLFVVLRSWEDKADAEAERQKAHDLATNQAELTAEEFVSLSDAPEFTGVYILHNETKGMYYVGQSVRVMQRVRQHLTGHGNGDVYADYKYGDHFTVRTISLASSGYLSIDDLERDMIEAYDAYERGYNRQRGNGDW